LNAKNECGDVIVLARASHEYVHVVHDAVECFRCAFNHHALKTGDEPRLAELLLRLIYSFDKAIRKYEEDVAGTKLDAARRIADSILRKRWNSKRRPAYIETLNLASGAAEDGMIMSGVHVDDLPRVDVEFGEKRCRETAALETVRAAIAIEVGNDLI
jgi:hypothetical protein